MQKDLNPILARHSKEIIQYLIAHNIHFSVQCKSSSVQFDPVLPKDISKNFHPIIDFILAGFTFESIEIWDSELSFEAGFGKDNFPSLVIIPFASIIQISIPTNNNMMRDICIFMNAMNFLDLSLFGNLEAMQEEVLKELMANDEEEKAEDDLLESSKKAILSNPNNKFR